MSDSHDTHKLAGEIQLSKAAVKSCPGHLIITCWRFDRIYYIMPFTGLT